jgi:hypothetical protein
MTEIINDLRHGKYIETYLIIFLAVIILIFNIVDIGDERWMNEIILAFLAIMAFGRIKDHRRLENVSIIPIEDGTFMARFPEDMKLEIKKSKELLLIGVSLHSFIEEHYREFEEKLKRGNSLKILLVNPSGEACKLASMRMPVPSGDHQRTRIENALTLLIKLKENCTRDNQLEIRTIEYPLDFEAYVVDPDSRDGILYMRHFGFKNDRGLEPKIVVRANKGHWFIYLEEETRHLWNSGIEWS